jgi:hypothetical protein
MTQVSGMTDDTSHQPGRVLADHLDYLVATAARSLRVRCPPGLFPGYSTTP